MVTEEEIREIIKKAKTLSDRAFETSNSDLGIAAANIKLLCEALLEANELLCISLPDINSQAKHHVQIYLKKHGYTE